LSTIFAALSNVCSWPVCDDAFLLNPAAKIHSQIGAGQFTLGIAVIGYAAAR
jgi:hypothetical protein